MGLSANLPPRFLPTFSGGRMEAITAAMVTFDAVALLASWVVLLIASWKNDFTWGLCTLFLPPLSYL